MRYPIPIFKTSRALGARAGRIARAVVVSGAVLLACAAPTVPPHSLQAAPRSTSVGAQSVPPAPPVATALPTAAASEPAALAPQSDEDNLVAEPTEPAPSRAEMTGTAALVWDMTPAPPNPHGPLERARMVTRFVVADGNTAKVVAERPEAVFASNKTLWHLRARKFRSYGCDCTWPNGGQNRAPPYTTKDLAEVVFQSLEAKPRVVAPMQPLLKRSPKCEGNETVPWARLDIEAMVGPYVTYTLDGYRDYCEAAHPEGSASSQLLDLEVANVHPFAEPPGVRAKLRPAAQQLLTKSCRGHANEMEDDANGFAVRYDAQGDLVAEYGFLGYSAYSCYHGIVRVRVGSFDLPHQMLPYGRLPTWLRGWLKAHPSKGIAVIAPGEEARAQQQFEALPTKEVPLPAHSGSYDQDEGG